MVAAVVMWAAIAKKSDGTETILTPTIDYSEAAARWRFVNTDWAVAYASVRFAQVRIEALANQPMPED